MQGDARRPVDGRMHELVDLLCDAFSPASLRALVLQVADRELVDGLPNADAVGRRAFARSAAEALARRGLVAAPLWDALARARPARTSEVRTLSEKWRAPGAALDGPAAPVTVEGLRDRLVAEFSAAELADLVTRAFPELTGGLDAITSPNAGTRERADSLIKYCRRWGWIARLAAAVAETRQ